MFVSDSDFPPWGISIFCCDSVELYSPPAPLVSRSVCELTPLSVCPQGEEGGLPALARRSWAVGTKALVETLTAEILTGDLLNRMEFPVLVLTQEKNCSCL